ncbi:MAG: hypothetical protein SH847_12985 [Roseiflexaceae bacterium]|nr:hypothetical protein [Roseiflexaceae bacterium]
MVEAMVELIVIVLWSAALSIHARRLLRLARVETSYTTGNPLRQRLARVWWWLGREEFWHAVQVDCLRCMQLTIMVFFLVLGAYR